MSLINTSTVKMSYLHGNKLCKIGQLDVPSLIPTNKIKFKREHEHNRNLKKLQHQKTSSHMLCLKG